MQAPIVGIYDSLANCPPALEQLGRAFMLARHPTCNLKRISATGYQQVGNIVLQAMRGQNFPKIDLTDTTPSRHPTEIFFCRRSSIAQQTSTRRGAMRYHSASIKTGHGWLLY